MSTLSGSQALGSIEQSLNEAKRDLETTNKQLAEAAAAKADLQRQESQAYRELAGLRLDVLARDAMIQELDASERQALSLLDDHKAALAALDTDLAAKAESGESLPPERATLVEQMKSLAERIDEAEAKTQARLADDPAFVAQLEAATAAEAIVKRAERKAEQAREDRAEKGKPYEEDALFMYLWNRGYGTARYRAFPLFRWLDGKVAGLCGYAAARPNYAMLMELPVKLGEHVEEVRARAGQEAERLEDLEREALAADGVADLATSFAELEAGLEALDARIATHDEELAALQHQRSQLMAGEGDSFQKALEVLSAAFRQDGVRALYRDALATSMPDDDIIVERLEDIADRNRDQENDAAHLKAMRVSQAQRVKELDVILNQFRNQRFDSNNSVFSDPALIALILSQFMKGGLSSDGVWDTLRRQQRFEQRRANPRFGSGGLSRRTGRRSGGRPLGPIGGGFGGRSSGGGGFRTGGSIRSSGGFRTGGSF